MGRSDVVFFNPQNPVMNFIEDYLPNMHYFAIVHDNMVGYLNPDSNIVIDLLINVESMPIAYIYAFMENSLSAFMNFIEYATRVFGKPPVEITPCCPPEFFSE